MKYDIAAKVVIEIGKEAIVRRFLELDAETIQSLEELPQETVNVRRSDFPLRVTLTDGRELIVLIEIQTEFNREFVLRLIDYTVRFMIKYNLEVIPYVFLISPSSQATGIYKDKYITFNYQVFRFWEESAKDFLDETFLCPFIPLMKDGEKILIEAENRIYNNTIINMETKGDLLTAMALFAGFKNKDLTEQLIKRRRDIMMQSSAYEILVGEAEKDALQKGMQKGIQQGMQQGMQQALFEALKAKFETIPARLIKTINNITDIEILKMLQRDVIKCSSIQEFKERMKSILED